MTVDPQIAKACVPLVETHTLHAKENSRDRIRSTEDSIALLTFHLLAYSRVPACSCAFHTPYAVLRTCSEVHGCTRIATESRESTEKYLFFFWEGGGARNAVIEIRAMP